MNGYWIEIANPGGTLDRRFATTEEDARQAALELVSEMAFMTAGDVIRVTEGSSEG